MAYSNRDLFVAYVAAAEGAQPDEGMIATLEGLAARNQAGELTDAEALASLLVRADVITAAISEILRFFNRRPPRQIDVAPVAEAVGESARSSPFSAHNQLIGFAASLGLGQGRREFQAAYGPLEYPAFAASAYEALITSQAARAAGYDPERAVADTAGRFDSFLSLLQGENLLEEAIASEDEALAVKAATVGYLICESIKWGFGTAAERATAAALALVTAKL